MSRPRLTIAMCLVLSGLLAVRTPRALADELPQGVLADGTSFRGQLAEAADGRVLFHTGDLPRDVSLEELVSWGQLFEPRQAQWVLLADGGILVVSAARFEAEHLLARSPLLGGIKVPMAQIAGLVLNPPADPAASDAVRDEVLSATGRSDRLLLDNGDELSGTITALDTRDVTLQAGSDKQRVPLGNLVAISLNPALRAQARIDSKLIVGLQDGSRIPIAKLSTDGKSARLEAAPGLELSVPMAAITFLQSPRGRAVYLSDLEPAGFRHLPYLSLSWPLARDRAVHGGELRVRGTPHLKGLGMHSPARVTFDLDRPCAQVAAEVAIDARSGNRGSAVFRVLTDAGDGQWQEKVATPIVRGGQEPLAISADLKGARRISLLVDFADRGDELDHANWLNARVVPAR